MPRPTGTCGRKARSPSFCDRWRLHARRAADIHGVIVASGREQDGRTTGLSLPSATSQRQLLDKVYGDFGIDPSDLMFVEAHGTGTKVGDPIEADALGKGLAQRRAKPLPIGSVKSNAAISTGFGFGGTAENPLGALPQHGSGDAASAGTEPAHSFRRTEPQGDRPQPAHPDDGGLRVQFLRLWGTNRQRAAP